MISREIPYLNCDISQGKRAVIEAAAGTGKTYNITNIVARIILERSDVSIDNMVIVTFTRAAAGELKTRISQRLAELEKALQAEGEVQDELLKKVYAKGLEKKVIQKRVRLALLNFDRAMIGTIHSFAMRSLSEYSFSSKLQFEFTLNEAAPAVVKELCHDFYRSFFYKEENSLFRDSLKKEFLEDYCFKRLANPALEIVWPFFSDVHLKRLEELEQEKQIKESELSQWDGALKVLDERLTALKKDLNEKQQAKKQKEEFEKSLPSRSEERRNAHLETEKAAKICKDAKEETDKKKKEKTELEGRISANKQALKNLLSEKKQIDDLAGKNALKEICEQVFDYVKKQYDRISREKNFLSNDDLILKMGDALEDVSFVRQLQQTFPVGLIDEFQDTNDSQFKIFRKVFLENPDSTFLVVGDPRQAIYRFRNCDIKTYLDAKKMMCSGPVKAQEFSMNTNRRSGKKYIDALNAIFTTPEGGVSAFAMADMHMPIQSAVEGSPVLLTPAGKEIEHPIQCAVNTDFSYQKIYDQCAADIYKLVQEKYQIPEDKGSPVRPVTFGDIAILTSKWRTAAMLRDSLQKLGIPARLMSYANVFDTPEAQELLIFLEGILNFSNKDALLRALITSLTGFELPYIKSEQHVEECAGIFSELNTLWHKRSFLTMFNELLVRFNTSEHLCRHLDGERRLSNFLTIADILGEEAFTRKLTPLALLNSLQKHITRAQNDEKDSFPGHPETDRGTVLIDTVFGSKGLSYPLVYLPDLFYVSNSFDSNMVSGIFHDAEGRLCYEPFISTTGMAIEHDEMIQDNLRKAYVAFTRAKYYCRFYYGSSGKFKRASSIDWLFRNHGITEYTGLFAKLAASTSQELNLPPEVSREDIDFDHDLKALENGPRDKLRRSDLFPELLSQSGFLSFSSITPHSAFQSSFASDKEDENDGSEELAEDLLLGNEPPQKKEVCRSMLLPRGTNFGNAVHKIMETCDYRSTDISECTAAALRIHGLSDENAEPTREMLQKVLTLPVPDADGGTFRLADIDPARKQCELEFLYEFSQTFSTRHLFNFAKKYFEEKFKCTCPDSADATSTYDSGFFNGSIDLFFEHKGKYYIVDWKTNLLKDFEYYSSGNLPAAMAGSRYYVQYMIYTAALFKYLKQRLPAEASEEEFYNKYIGGVRYFFVRGVYHTDGHGIFSDRLSYEKYKELESIIG